MKIKETVTHEPSTGLGDCCDAPPPVPHEKNAAVRLAKGYGSVCGREREEGVSTLLE